MRRTHVVGSFRAVEGKLSPDDSRFAYVEGPTKTGRIAPLASLHSFADAVRWAKQASARYDLPGDEVANG